LFYTQGFTLRWYIPPPSGLARDCHQFYSFGAEIGTGKSGG